MRHLYVVKAVLLMLLAAPVAQAPSYPPAHPVECDNGRWVTYPKDCAANGTTYTGPKRTPEYYPHKSMHKRGRHGK